VCGDASLKWSKRDRAGPRHDFRHGHASANCFRSPRSRNQALAARNPTPPHPIDIIWAELDARGLRLSDLAARMGDDPLKNRALLFHYLHHPSRELELGRMPGDGWLVLARDHAWAHGDRHAAVQDAQWLSANLRLPVRVS